MSSAASTPTAARPEVFGSDLASARAADRNPIGVHEDDDDEIVAEVPVYLNSSLAKNLYLFQYPLRNAPFSDTNGPMAARLKPKANMVELDLPINTRSNNYSTERGEDFAMGLSEKSVKTIYDKQKEHDDEDIFGRSNKKEEELLDRMTLNSTEVPAQTNYLVGMLHEGGLHLTPVRSTVQMRPAFKYIDKMDEKYKAANKRIQDAEKMEDEKIGKQENTKAQAIQVSMKGGDNNTPARRNAYSMAVRNAEEEPWQAVVYYNERTSVAEAIGEQLYCTDKTPVRSGTTREEYLIKLSGIKQQASV
ncbi:DNA-directed RNA polymerase III subunit Rpc5 [Syncephalastrum racemosum]|uniref:DNA-directed RNA polymerase III subunit Rpc5 n=1 Tax=Syncephalastrum racemosum TaxID=13706 RepID=A0A1X2H5D9_SYNRA|nr:DNA-directed RNA polymerase III subunit Rpc5 [Syncephalastrum racemosum]